MTRLSEDEVAQMAQEVAEHSHAWVHLWDSTKIAALLDEVVAARAALASPPSPEGEREALLALALSWERQTVLNGTEHGTLVRCAGQLRNLVAAPRPPSSPDPVPTCATCGREMFTGRHGNLLHVDWTKPCAPAPRCLEPYEPPAAAARPSAPQRAVASERARGDEAVAEVARLRKEATQDRNKIADSRDEAVAALRAERDALLAHHKSEDARLSAERDAALNRALSAEAALATERARALEEARTTALMCVFDAIHEACGGEIDMEPLRERIDRNLRALSASPPPDPAPQGEATKCVRCGESRFAGCHRLVNTVSYHPYQAPYTSRAPRAEEGT